jgi:lysophospholipase L1-like esterase
MPRKQRAFFAIMLLLVGAAAEGVAAVTTRVLVRRGWMAEIPALGPAEQARYFAWRNPLLGWGPRVDTTDRRPPPTRADPGPGGGAAPCASTYGDSFTWGLDVPPDGAYPHQLGMLLGCGVVNYGVPGYGSDQALLLFRAQARGDRAPVVVLAHVSENVLRNVNQYRNLLYPGQQRGFKPRFVVDGDSLRLVPIPIHGPEDLRDLPAHPARHLAYEAFLGRPRRGFPYTWSLLRWTVSDYHVRARLGGYPRHRPFYQPGHPAGGLAVTTRILAAFAREARARGRAPFVLLVPTGPDFAYARQTGEWADQPLADALAREGVAVIHVGPEMLRRLGGREPCTLFTDCSGHFNVAGYRMLAEVAAEGMRAAGAAGRRALPGQGGRGEGRNRQGDQRTE